MVSVAAGDQLYLQCNDTMGNDLVNIIRRLASCPGFDPGAVECVRPLTPDGSLRRFFRVRARDGATAVAVLPPPGDDAAMREAHAAWQIGRHLAGCGVPVPVPYGFEPVSGLLLCEDLGDRRLHDVVLEDPDSGRVRTLYRQAVTELARMQVLSGRGLEPAWCWDGSRYDRALMLERESGYFVQALCRDLLGLDAGGRALTAEFEALADAASRAPAGFFLHRDFQSRNIMVRDDRIFFIDFQAGRFGPLAYDLASLLIDPYAGLDRGLRDELVSVYLDAVNRHLPYDRQRFMEEFLVLALQRNLQILGAFAFLSQRRQKRFFRAYLRPALAGLQTLLAKPGAAGYPALRQLADQCDRQLKELHDL